MTMHVPYAPPLISRPVQRGPIMISIPGISGVSVGAGLDGAEVAFRWPQRMILREWILIPQSGLAADAGALSLRMVDEEGEMIFDGLLADAQANFVSPLALEGLGHVPLGLAGWTWSPRWARFGRLVSHRERWTFQVHNAAGGAITPRLLFAVEMPIE